MYVSSVPENAEFDFIVVGAGLGRLRARQPAVGERAPHACCCSKRAAAPSSINLKIPLMVAKILNDERYTWQYQTEPQTHLNNKPQRWVRGRVIGGSGSINGNLFVRGDPLEYDGWRDQGCAGWGYSDLMPYFKRLEDYPEGDPAVRGRGGPIHCTNLDKFDPLSDAFVAACGEAGYRQLAGLQRRQLRRRLLSPVFDAQRLAQQLGGGVPEARARPRQPDRADRRAGHARPDGRQARDRRRVPPRRREPSRCAPAARSCCRRGRSFRPSCSSSPASATARSCASTASASCITCPAWARTCATIPARASRSSARSRSPSTTSCAVPWLKLKEGLRWMFKSEGLLTICSATAQVVLAQRSRRAQPDLAMLLQPLSGKDRYARTPGHGLDPHPGFTFELKILQPRSVGTLHIRSARPARAGEHGPEVSFARGRRAALPRRHALRAPDRAAAGAASRWWCARRAPGRKSRTTRRCSTTCAKRYRRAGTWSAPARWASTRPRWSIPS